MGHLLYLMFRCDGDVMESLDFGEFLRDLNTPRVNALVQQPARPSAPERLVTAGAATPAGALKACVHGEARL